jgi:phosphohistidine phosphatase SixA
MQLLTALTLAAQVAAAPAASAELRGEELMQALRSGGYTILLRHARTDRSFQEARDPVPVDRSAQRNLSADGVRDAALMGAVFRKYRIPIGEIVASPMFRTRETAEYAAGPPTRVTMALRVLPATDEQAAVVAAAPAPGTNRLLVTHHFVIETHVPGIRPGDVGESEAAVVRPTGDGRVALVGRITLPDWERLAGVAPRTAPSGQTTPASDSARTVLPTAAQPPAPAAHAVPGTHVAIPDTRAGQLARRYLEAFNSGDPARMREFIESSLLPNPDRPTDARLQSYGRTFEDLGRLTVTGVRTSSADEVTLAIRAKGGEFFLTARASPEQPGRAVSITIGTTRGSHP